ncbi:3-oxoacyl-[acyl-carrier-protein] synthase III C-terminal domain-containing protein [Kibdelosporangium aridum]|uniref:3-oxoacyl-[acyl-carrier-protein] synthase III C-terminal domain-containing protein n=1 Tax=Kibdelosporangium aridum TaxID=2030 RepID=UPI001F31ED6D|nr:3-oxoacyl-[acyl-carrier-protein] synthase III C-terminal domain-containing protein [Kibdelosporangium aridum]
MLANFPDVLAKGSDPEVTVTGTRLAAQAVRGCLEKSDLPTRSIGLVLGVSTSPGRLLPGLANDLFTALPEIPRSAVPLNLAYMGCSALPKAVETARWYLTSNPDRTVLMSFMDSNTPLNRPFEAMCLHFSEGGPQQDTVDAVNAFLFGDAAVAMLMTAEGDGSQFGPVTHLTNVRPEDAELGTIPDGGSDAPIVHGRKTVTRTRDVPARGLYYATKAVRDLLAREDCALSSPQDAARLLMHTGSRRILDVLCDELGVPTDGEQTAIAYQVLRHYGNTLSSSVPLMVGAQGGLPPGESLLVTFGMGFSAGATTLHVPA